MTRSSRGALLLIGAIPLLGGCRSLFGTDADPLPSGHQVEAALPAAAAGDALELADFRIRARGASGRWVQAHRITAAWDESTVTWNSFDQAYDPTPLDSFLVDAEGWFSVDLREVLPAWATADEPFHGLLLRHEALATPRSVFDSREDADAQRRPHLELIIQEADSLVHQRIEVEADAFIWHAQSNNNYGDRNPLYAGWAQPTTNVQMQTLLRFPLPELPLHAAVGDRVWLDADADGLQDADEPGLADVLVELRSADRRELVASAFSDAEGGYAFAALEPGDYVLRVVPPYGYELTLPDQGDDPQFDSDADPVSGFTPIFALAAGQEDSSRDFGLRHAPVTHWEPRSVGFWRRQAGCGQDDDLITPLLPLWVGTPEGTHSIAITDAATAAAVLKQRHRSKRRSGITQLRAQLLAAQLNLAAGAESGPGETIAAADAFLATTPCAAWRSLDRKSKREARRWRRELAAFNRGH